MLLDTSDVAPVDGDDVGRCGWWCRSLDLVASFKLGSVVELLLPELCVTTLDVWFVPSAELTVDEEDVAALAKCNCELVGVDGCDANRGKALASNNDPEPVVPVLFAASGGNLAPPLEPVVVVGVPECA